MSSSCVLTLALATLGLPNLQPLRALSSQPCLRLSEQIAALIAGFLATPITPAATLDFENALRLLLDECGRHVLENAINFIEPSQAQDSPKHIDRDHQEYARKNQKMRQPGRHRHPVWHHRDAALSLRAIARSTR